MRMTLPGLVLLALAACTGTQLGGPQTLAPSVQLADVSFAEPGVLEQAIGLELRFTNPNPAPIQADGLRFAISLSGDTFGNGVSDQAFEIPRLGEAVVPVTIRVQTGDLINQLLSLDGETIDYRITGDLFQSGSLGGRSQALAFDDEASIAVPDVSGVLGRLQNL